MGILGKIHKLFRVWDTRRIIRNIKFLICEDIDYAIDYAVVEAKGETIENCIFELDELREAILPRVPSILRASESLDLFERQPKSIARFGDGEIAIMEGRNIPFQRYEPLLAEKMLAILRTKRDDMYVGLNSSYFHSVALDCKTEHSRRFLWKYGAKFRKFFMREANPEVQYLCATLFIGYFFSDNDESYSAVIDRRKRLFAGRKIAVVTGKSVLANLDYDIFELAASKIIIDAPSKNAFSAYDSILRDISNNISKDTLICLILGPTATAMAADLTDMGYMAWDIGHIAKDYDAFMKKLGRTSQVLSKFFVPD